MLKKQIAILCLFPSAKLKIGLTKLTCGVILWHLTKSLPGLHEIWIVDDRTAAKKINDSEIHDWLTQLREVRKYEISWKEKNVALHAEVNIV